MRRALPAIRALALATALAALAAPASAQTVADPAGDILPTYTGPRNGDMDVLSASATYNGSFFQFSSTQAAAIGTTPGAFYVWGINRGQGTSRFPDVAPGVLFDAVVILRPDGTAQFNDLINGTRNTPLVGAVTVSGNTISGLVSASVIGTLAGGLAPSAFTVNVWPRIAGPTTAAISDFAPNNANFMVATVPEPSTWMLLGGGLAMLGVGARRRRPAA